MPAYWKKIHCHGILIHHTADNYVIKYHIMNCPGILKTMKRNAEEKIIEISKALNDIRLTVSDAPRKYIDNTLEIIGKYYTTDS